MQLRVLTFNVWGIPVAQHRTARIARLGQVLRTNAEQYDLVALLECWLESDRSQLIAAAKEGGLEHHIFFRSGCGFPGGDSSGLVILSRWPIVNCFYHRFTAAGKAQKILHWDYSLYSGKGIGVAHINAPEPIGEIDFYISHFVAYYTAKPEDPDHDEYTFHRRLGAWEAAQFVKSTRRQNSFVAFCVDLNADPKTLTYRALKELSGLNDAWVEGGRVRKHRGFLPDMTFDASESSDRTVRQRRSQMLAQEKENSKMKNLKETFDGACRSEDEAEQRGLTVNYPGNCYFENNTWIASGEPSARVDYVLFSDHDRIKALWCERRFAGKKDSDSLVSLSDHAAVLACFSVEEGSQAKALDTKEENQADDLKMTEKQMEFACSASAKLLEEMAFSSQCGIQCALRRRRIAIRKTVIFAVVSLLSLVLPVLMGVGESGLTIGWVLVQFVICTGFAVSSFSYFILANIAIPDEESAMRFMLASIKFQQGQRLGDESAMNIS